jgi:hypothetical protein
MKEIIAICRSGGEFETSKDDGALSYHGGEAYAIDINQRTRLADFKKELADTFECSVSELLIKYLLPGNKNTLITISKDKDFKRMVSFYSNLENVDVFVTIVPPAARNGSNVLATRSSKTKSAEEVTGFPGIPTDTAGTAINTVAPVAIDTAGITINLEDTYIPTVDTSTSLFTNTTFETEMPMEPIFENLRNEKNNNKDTILGVGQIFNTFTAFREALKKYSMENGFSFKFKKNETHRVTVVCKSHGCPWRIHVSRLATTQLVSIKTMTSAHTCEGSSDKPDRATRSWIGSIIRDKLKVFPDYKPKDIAIDIQREYGIQLNYSQAFRAKESAMEQIHGSFKQSYNQLPFYCEKITESNPGSIANYTTNQDSSFRTLFVSFSASITGFKNGCRPLIFLNSTPLYSKYQGVLFGATAADGNDDVFPVAFAIVDEESDASWRWFLSQLKLALSSSTSRKITFVADIEKGIRDSLREIFAGEFYHGYCLLHLAEKLSKNLKGQYSHEARDIIVKELYSAAYATKDQIFEQCIANIKSISIEAYNFIVNNDPHYWANLYFDGARYNHITSNHGEVFYNWVSEACDLPITHLVDVLRTKMTDMIFRRRAESSQWKTRLTPVMEEKLKKEVLKARSLQLQVVFSHNGGSIYEVRGNGDISDVVDMENGECSCKTWQITGLPCCHAISVLQYLNMNLYDYCLNYFTVDSYRLSYNESIMAVPNMVEKLLKSEVTKAAVNVTPPPTRRPPGRPKLKQDGSEGDVVKHKPQCSMCKSIGHNKRSCNCNSDGVHQSSNPISIGWALEN